MSDQEQHDQSMYDSRMTTSTFELRLEEQEVFTHNDDDGTTRMFLIGEMNRLVVENPRCTELIYHKMKIEDRVVNHINNNMGIEQERLDRLEDPYLSVPCLGIIWPDDNQITIVDGNHRIIKFNTREKGCYINVVAFKHPFWEGFLVPDDIVKRIADDRELIDCDSGLIEWEKRRIG